MFQHTTSEVIIIQLQINLNSKIQIKLDRFEILATGRSDMHCKIKESLLFRDLKPALNENVGSENFIYILAYCCLFMPINFVSSQSVQLYFWI